MLLRRFLSFSPAPSFSLLFGLFFHRIPIDLVLMRFECPSVCAERWGENRVGGGPEGGGLLPSVGISIQSGEGGGPKERHSCEN